MALNSPDEIAKEKVLAIQDYSVLAGNSVSTLFQRPRYIADMLVQADLVGFGSLPITTLTGLSIGAVLALQTSSTLQQFGVVNITGQLVSFSMIKEIGPVLTSLMVAGRASTGMASELGSMKVFSGINVPAAMMEPAPMRAPFRMIDPMPIRQRSSITQPCKVTE